MHGVSRAAGGITVAINAAAGSSPRRRELGLFGEESMDTAPGSAGVISKRQKKKKKKKSRNMV